ncbi:MAG: hypothetical protein JWR80_6677 [Bradyrhizobium sp.]|nr:hypothetical protein [Bradyrhizobium sp.]
MRVCQWSVSPARASPVTAGPRADIKSHTAGGQQGLDVSAAPPAESASQCGARVTAAFETAAMVRSQPLKRRRPAKAPPATGR